MNKLSKEKQQQIGIVAFGSVAIIALLWVFVISAQRDSLAKTKAKNTETVDKITKADRLVKQTASVQANVESIRRRLDTIEENFAAGDLYSWVILTMNKFRAPYKVDIRNFSREEIVKVGLLPDFPYDGAKYILTGSAHFHDLGHFIADFENQFPYFRVQNLDIALAESSTGPEDEKITFRMEIVALIKPNPTVPVSAKP